MTKPPGRAEAAGGDPRPLQDGHPLRRCVRGAGERERGVLDGGGGWGGGVWGV